MGSSVTTIEDLKTITILVMTATCPEEVFGVLVGDQKLALSQIYKAKSKDCYPDFYPDQKKLATSTFQELGRWRGIAEKKIEAGSYGDNKPWVEPRPYKPSTFSVGRENFTCTSLLDKGSLTTVHNVQGKNLPWEHWFLKISNNPANNDLLDREFKVLTALYQESTNAGQEKFFAIQRNYIPTPLNSFLIAGKEGKKHRANLLGSKKARTFTAEKLIEEKFPDGIEAKHLYWIYRRALMTCWMAHLNGYVYGNLTPDHLLIYPKEHGLVLLDWTAATKIGTKVPIVNKRWEDFYPPEILAGEPATPASDLYMAAKMALYLSQTSPLPPSVRARLIGCLAKKNRPDDAEKFHEEFGRTIEKEHGPRKYAEFEVP